MVDIFSVPKKEKINRTLLGKVINLAGMPKVGKSTVAAGAPDPIFLCTENGVENIVGITPIPIATWSDFVQAVNQLCTPKAKEMFKTVVIDSMTQLLVLLEKYEGSRQSTEKVQYQFASDMDYGKGNKGMKLLLGTQLQKLANQGYLTICITHCEMKSNFDTGKQYVGSSISNAIYNILERLVDQTIYLDRKESKNGKIEYRAWFNPKGGFSGAGGRFACDVDYTETSYKNIEDVLLRAMDEQAEKTGAEMTNEMKSSVNIETEDEMFDYDALMKELNDITSSLVDKSGDNVAKISKSIASVLGPNRKATSLTKNQVELLNEVVQTLKHDFELN